MLRPKNFKELRKTIREINAVNSTINLNIIDTSLIFNMNSLFQDYAVDIIVDKWDVSNVNNMCSMFADASIFNQPLNKWDVSSVTDMSLMFKGAKLFNQPLNNWDVSNVTNMYRMFDGAKKFNQPLSNWDVSSVTNMSSMF